jgi:hypothetical protein
MQLITRTGRHLSPSANRFLQYCMQGMQAFHGRIKYVRPYRKSQRWQRAAGPPTIGHRGPPTAIHRSPSAWHKKGQADKPGPDGHRTAALWAAG